MRTIKLFFSLFSLMVILSFFTVSAAEPVGNLELQIVNKTSANITVSEIDSAYYATLERYRKVLPPARFALIDNSKIEAIYIVEQISKPEVSKLGLTEASVDLDTGEVDSVKIEVRPGYRQGLKSMSFRALMEHEFAHAFAFMAGLPQAQQIGHSIEIEQLHID